MMDIYSYSDYESNPRLAIPKLGELVRDGVVQLFLGAGVSKGFGLPEWKPLIARVLGREGDSVFLAKLDLMSDKDAAKTLDSIDDGSAAYQKKIHEALYRDVRGDLIEQLQRSPLLLSVAALTTGTIRGRVQTVTTYNYDDLLEQYLRMLGYAVCVRTAPDELALRADVTISHPHGSLPQKWDGAGALSQIVFSEKSYRERRAAIDEGWPAGITHELHSKIGLFLGLSADDSSLLDVLKRTQKSVRGTRIYNGYWLMTPEAFERNKAEVLDVGSCPIRLAKEEMPGFVLEVCQNAAG